MINITLLGSGGGIPIPDRFLSSMIIDFQGRKVLIDCGEGTQVAMRKTHSGFKSIDIICISHLHGDHIFGLPGLLSTIANSDRVEDITIVGPEGSEEVINGLLIAIPYLPYNLNIMEVREERLAFSICDGMLNSKEEFDDLKGDIIISTMELDHSSPCIGYSFYIPRKPKFDLEKAIFNNVPKRYWKSLQKGEIIVKEEKRYQPHMVLGENRKGIKMIYITDTRPINSIIEFINESDLFVCEGTYGDNEDLDKAIKNKHMTFSEAAMLAKEGDVRQLLLTHFSSAMKNPNIFEMNAKDLFSNTIIGYDGFEMSLSFE